MSTFHRSCRLVTMLLPLFFAVPFNLEAGFYTVAECGGESLDCFFTNKNTGQAVSDGMVLPVGSELDIDVTATAYGQCRSYYDSPPTYNNTLIGTYNRLVHHVNINIATPWSSLGGWYQVYNMDEAGFTAFRQELDSRSANTTQPNSFRLHFAGRYDFEFVNIIMMSNCPQGSCPESVVKTATIYAVADCAPSDPEIPSREVCDDGKDNDCDGSIDCADTDCSMQAVCICNNKVNDPGEDGFDCGGICPIKCDLPPEDFPRDPCLEIR